MYPTEEKTYILYYITHNTHVVCSSIYIFCLFANYTLKSLLWPIKASLDAIICKMHEVKLDGGDDRNAPSSVQQHWFDKPYILYVRWQHALHFCFLFLLICTMLDA